MNNFPVENKGYNDFEEYLSSEGLATVTGSWNTAYIWGGESNFRLTNGISSSRMIDNCLYIKSVTICASRPSLFSIFSVISSSGLGADFSYVFINGTATIPINQFKKIDALGFGIGLVNIPDINPGSIVASINQAGFMVTKGATLTVVNANLKTFSLIVTLTNYSGSSSSGSIVISDVLPVGCDFISAAGTGFTLSQTGKTYTMSTTDVIANNGTKTYVLTVKTSVSTDFSYSFSGYSISNDIDLSLRPSVWAGTSITNGSGATSYRTNYTLLLKKWLSENLNINVRNVNKAIQGSQTNIMEDYRVFNNFYDFKQEPKFLWIEHGVNDISQSIATATSVANVTKMINYYRKKYPTCYIMILAAFPVGVTGTEAGLVTYRTAMQTLVNGYPDADKVYLKYISGTGSVWNPVTQSGTYTTDNIHVNDAGRVLIFNAITAYITANSLTFS